MTGLKVLTRNEVAAIVPTADQALDMSRTELQDRIEELVLSHEAIRELLTDFHDRAKRGELVL